MNDETFEYAASEKHARWFQEQWSRGIVSKKSDLGHELMVPYEMLHEEAKDIFRKLILTERIFPVSE